MNRLILSWVTGLGLLLATAPAHATSALLMGAAQSLNLDSSGCVQDLSVNVKRGWLNGDALYLEIAITSVNGMAAFHGQTCVPVSATEVFGTDRDVAEVVIDSTGLDAEQHTPGEQITYTVNVIVRVDGCDGTILTTNSTEFQYF